MVSGFLGNSHISSTFGQAVSSPSLEVVSGGAAENERVPREWGGEGRRKGEKPVLWFLMVVSGKSWSLETQHLIELLRVEKGGEGSYTHSRDLELMGPRD